MWLDYSFSDLHVKCIELVCVCSAKILHSGLYNNPVLQGSLGRKTEVEFIQFTGKQQKKDRLLNVKLRPINSGIMGHGLIGVSLVFPVLVHDRFLCLPVCLTSSYTRVCLTAPAAAPFCSAPPQREETGPQSQEEYLPPAAGRWLPLLQTHGPWTRERHTQLPGLISCPSCIEHI